MPIKNRFAELHPEITGWRRHLHTIPELQFDLPKTSAYVEGVLREMGIADITTGIAQTGIVAVIEGRTNTSGRVIGLRADMDALPIEEATGLDYTSTHPGKMHACGHDGHTTMLLGAARHLVESRAFDGRVIVIFQPAEEGGAGAKAMIDDGLFTRWPCDEVYGMHNRPNLPVGQFTIAPGPIMGSVDEVRIHIEGRGGHAARPDETIDTFPIAAAIINAVQTITARTVDPMDNAVVSLCTIHAGNAFNVIPQTLDITGTVRTLREEVRSHIEGQLAAIVPNIAAGFGATATLDYIRMYPVTVNHDHETQLAAQAAQEVAGVENVSLDMPPVLGGEDFSFMLNEVPGAMINVGNGPSAGLHHPKYDFNDDVIAWGCSYWTTLVRQRLPLG